MSSAKASYVRAMEALYVFCIGISGLAVVAITIAVPYGVFMRYVMESPASWPEPFSVLMMVMFTFVGGAGVFRAKVHVAIKALTENVGEKTRNVLRHVTKALMVVTVLFMVIWGAKLVQTTMHQTIAEFPWLPVGIAYLPIPVGGVLTLLFLVEWIWIGELPPDSVVHSDTAAVE